MSATARNTSRPLWLTLALWTLPGLVFLLAAGLWLSAASLHDLSDSAYDRSLAGAIRAIDLNVSTESGGVGVELPYPLFESFQATASGEVYYRIATDDGLVQIGDALLPPPPPLAVGEMRFYDATYFDRPIRVAAFKRPLDRPLYGAASAQNIVIEVAETTGSREAFRRDLIRRAISRDALAVLVAATLLALGVRFALAPLSALKDRLDRREPDDRSRLDGAGLPREVRPLVGAMNDLLQRHRERGEAQRRFIDDASHQLKTPIAVLRSQVDFAIRSADPEATRRTLEAMRPVIDRAGRTTTQLLALARAENALLLEPSQEAAVDLPRLLREVARLHLAEARRGRIDLEIDAPEEPLLANGSEPLLFEALSNLLDNALRASPRGGRVVLSAAPSRDAGWLDVEVRDEGPGMDKNRLARAGERFATGPDAIAGEAAARTGLGLAIVATIARAHGGEMRLRNGVEKGLVASLRLSAPLGDGAAQLKAG
ncbi:sensor histidine kinase [Aureimonas ureilytica]|uniref:sensor histidine kinase n=1 Tax=Aureimonas ureilytica TaxID=401562 RepID=UPI0003A0F46D|nr:sensor histidine kinase [Aureimonas ureilytica]